MTEYGIQKDGTFGGVIIVKKVPLKPARFPWSKWEEVEYVDTVEQAKKKIAQRLANEKKSDAEISRRQREALRSMDLFGMYEEELSKPPASLGTTSRGKKITTAFRRQSNVGDFTPMYSHHSSKDYAYFQQFFKSFTAGDHKEAAKAHREAEKDQREAERGARNMASMKHGSPMGREWSQRRSLHDRMADHHVGMKQSHEAEAKRKGKGKIQQKLFNPSLKIGDRIQEGSRKGTVKSFHSKGTVDVKFDDMDYVIRRQLGSVKRINPRQENRKGIGQYQYHATSWDRLPTILKKGLQLPRSQKDVSTFVHDIPSLSTADKLDDAIPYHPRGAWLKLKVKKGAKYWKRSLVRHRKKSDKNLLDTVNRFAREAIAKGYDGIHVAEWQSSVGNQTYNPDVLEVVEVINIDDKPNPKRRNGKKSVQALLNEAPASWKKMFRRYGLSSKPTAARLINTVLEHTPSMKSAGTKGKAIHQVPKNVKKEAMKGLHLSWENNYTSASGIGLVRAMQLVLKDKIPERSIKRMIAYFARSKKETSKQYMAWLNWGGDTGKKWAESRMKPKRNAPGYQSRQWRKQDWRSVIIDGDTLDYTKKCGAKGTRLKSGKPRLCLPLLALDELSSTSEGKKILRSQARKKEQAKKGQRVGWHPEIRRLHQIAERRTEADDPRRRNKGQESQLGDIWYDWMMKGKKPSTRQGYLSVKELEPFREYTRSQLRNSPRTKHYRQLKDEIARYGVQEPLGLILGANGHAYIGEGNHRHEIAKDLGISHLPVQLIFWQKPSSKGGTKWSRWYKGEPSPSKDDLIDEILADLRLNPKGKKYPAPHDGRYNMDLNRYTMTINDKGDKVLLRYMDSARQTSIPLQSISQFVQDMTADYSEMNLSQIPHIDAIIKGKAKFLGKGMDGMVFKSLGDVVKVSTTVPFHPDQQTHRTPEQARRHTKKEFDLHRRLSHIPCVLPAEYVEWADRGWMIKPYLDLRDEKSITEKEFAMLAECIEAIHSEGVAVGDMVQYGRGKDGQIYLLDLGQSRTPTKHDYQDDMDYLARVAGRRDFSFKTQTMAVEKLKKAQGRVEFIALIVKSDPEFEIDEMDVRDFLDFKKAFKEALPYLDKKQHKEALHVFHLLQPLAFAHKKKKKNPAPYILIPPPPPEKKRVQELKKIKSQYRDRVIPPHLQKQLDERIGEAFNEIIKAEGLRSQRAQIKKWNNKIIKEIKRHKNHFNAERPAQLAKRKRIAFKSDNLKTAKTPSYPSGHTTQAYFLAMKLSEKYPKLAERFFNLANMVAQSRIDRGVHFPSDNFGGMKLAQQVFELRLIQ